MAGGKFANLVEEDGLLQVVELGGVEGDLSEERVGHQDGSFLRVAVDGVAQQAGDIDLESAREAVERGEGRHGLAIFNFRDVSARDAHARGKLALGKVADVTQVAYSCCYLEAAFRQRRCRNQGEGGWFGGGLLDDERFVATATGGAGCAELHQIALIAAQDLALFDGGHHGCHSCA